MSDDNRLVPRPGRDHTSDELAEGFDGAAYLCQSWIGRWGLAEALGVRLLGGAQFRQYRVRHH
jgi:hypothetical protein